MDIKTLTDGELFQLQQQIQVEVENRRAAAAAPALIQQTAERALSAGATPESLKVALEYAINPPEQDDPIVPEPPPEV